MLTLNTVELSAAQPMASLFNKMKELLAKDQQVDILPPDTQIPTHQNRRTHAKPQQPRHETPDLGKRLGEESSDNPIFVTDAPIDADESPNIEITQELHVISEELTLTEDDEFFSNEGYNPYDTNGEHKAGVWDKLKKR